MVRRVGRWPRGMVEPHHDGKWIAGGCERGNVLSCRRAYAIDSCPVGASCLLSFQQCRYIYLPGQTVQAGKSLKRIHDHYNYLTQAVHRRILTSDVPPGYTIPRESELRDFLKKVLWEFPRSNAPLGIGG
eukprot:561542-Rhodomonas_salina.1